MKLSLPRWDNHRFEIEPDVELLARLTADMELRGGDLKPATGWLALPENQVHGSLDGMLEPWCGIGQVPLADLRLDQSDTYVEMYVALCDRYSRRIDHLGLLKSVTLQDLVSAGWRVLDLDSLVDFLQISAFFDFNQERPVILEIGGGFGRLIEFITALTGRSFRYINIDAVPVSMMYCHQYLTARFPHLSTKVFNRSAHAHENDCDFLIVPAWDLEKLQLEPVNLAINIESMQEMNQVLVNFYIDYLDRNVREGGLIFLENSREHEFIGDWVFPDTWQCLFRHRTVRSWTIDHPTEIFCKTSTNQRPQNLMRSEAFFREISYAELVRDLTPEGQPYYPFGILKLLSL